MGKARFYKIILSLIILSLVMLITGCGGGGGGNSSVTPEELTTISVTGKILDSSNNPISGATVTITSDPVVVTTNQWGEFSAKVAPGEHTITVTKNNVTLYRSTFTAQEGSHIALGSITPNYPDSNGDTQAPTVPGSTIATAASSSQINLSWLASTDNAGVTAYRIYRNGTQLANTVTGTSYSDTGLSASTQYCYTVSAGDAKGNWSAQSTQSCATTLAAGSTGDTQAPTIPGSVTATAVSLSQINLNWSASSDNTGVTAYRIYRNGTQITNTVTGTTYSDAGLSASTQYCYTVSARDAAGNWSAQSTQSCATTLADSQAPTVPGSVTATAVSSSQINLSWSASADNIGVAGYRLYKGGIFLKQVAGTSTTDTGLSALTQYCYTVSAGDAAGNWSAQSSQGALSCATTMEVDIQAPTVPGSVIATAASSSQINLSWSPSTDNVGVTAYELYRGGILLKQVAGTSTTDTGLSASTQYCYTVRARDAAENWSAQSTQGAQSCATTQSTPLTVISVNPTSNAFNVATNAPISATFSNSVDPSTATGLNFAVSVGTSGVLIPGNVTCNGPTVVFTPIPNLTYGTSYRVTIRSGASGIKDMAGNALSSTYSWSFTTVYNQLYDLFIQFVEQPTDANYTALMNAIDTLGTTQEACLYKAMGELMDIYRSPVAAQMMQDFGLTVGLDTNFEQLSAQYTPEVLNTMVYNYLKLKLQNEAKHRYLINYENLLVEMEQRLTRVDNLLAQADGINLTVNIDQAESVKFDSIDIRVLRAMTNLLKANFIYLQSIDLDINNYTVTYNGSSRDIRDLMNEAVYDDTQSDAITRELCANPDNLNLLTYSNRARLTDFRNTLVIAFNHYGNAVTAIQNLTPVQNEARFLNAFSLDSDYALELAKSVRDYMMPSILNCIDSSNQLVELISPRSEETGQQYVDGGDGFYYLEVYYDIYLDHYRFDTTNILYGIKAYDLLNVNGLKSLRDMATEIDYFVRNTPEGTEYMPYRLWSTVYYLTGVVDKDWEEFLEEEEVPVAAISINGFSNDWSSVPVFGTVGRSTIKIARDAANNNVYIYIGSTYTPPAGGTYWNWHTSFSIYMDYGDYEFSNYDWFSISCTMNGSSSNNPTYTHSVYSWGQQVGNVVPSAIMQFSDSLGLEMRVDNILPTLLKRGSGNFFYASEYDSVSGSYVTSDRDIKLLPELP